MPIAKSYSNSKHTFAIEITRDNVHELIVWGKWQEFDMWDIYEGFIRAEKADNKFYLLIETNGFTLIYATSHVSQSFQTKLRDDFVKEFRKVKDSTQGPQFTRKFEFTEVVKKKTKAS